MSTSLHIRTATAADFDAVAELIYISTNTWYQTHGMGRIFSCPVSAARLFTDVYEDLDPGCCLLAVDEGTGRLAGSCFYRVRPTHVSLGIMNAHPAYFGSGAARKLLAEITGIADRENKPLRLVSSALNLDSFSLYNRAGFVPRLAFQDMLLAVPSTGIASPKPASSSKVRLATIEDMDAIVDLEREIQGIERPGDWRYFLENARGIWHTVVSETQDGRIDAVLASVAHPASNLIGPGVARSTDAMTSALWAKLDYRRGTTLVFLLPVTETALVAQAYTWGARNCELHFAQCRGKWFTPTGVVMPTFMPESA